MQDKEMRKILIEYLKYQHKKYRIFQEKSIGSSICDLMLVTDKLTGFEIKSDSDDYTKLSRQINAYNQFFDENYIVVGMSHAASAESKIPREWGIITVSPYNLEVVRKARPNRNVERIRQLSILWTVELKNILLKNRLPLYAQKGKPFLCEKIAEKVDGIILGSQIAEELNNREYSAYNSTDYTIRSGSPALPHADKMSDLASSTEEMIDRMSDEDLNEFTLDKWMAIYQKVVEKKALKDEQSKLLEAEYVTQQRKENKIPYTDISVSLGVPWVSAEIIENFIIEVLKVPRQYYTRHDQYTNTYSYVEAPLVQHEKITGYWNVFKCNGSFEPELTSIYGTKRYNAMRILEATLNLRDIRIYDGSTYNEVETIAALEKQKALQLAFEEWVWKDETRCLEIENAYNDLFGEYEVKTYDGSNIKFEGMNPDISLFPYQKAAVQKIISTPNTLLSFDVGSGKTYIMIAAAMEMRKNGLSRKNMFVVPNNIVGQWEKMFTELYPSAKVLTVDPKSFTPEKREKVLRQMKTCDYDGIIVAYSCFEMIPLSKDYVCEDMNKIVKTLIEGTKSISVNIFPNLRRVVDNEVDYIKKSVNEILSCISASETDITFDDLEINTLFVDEAHNFKNIPLRTTMKHVRGINITGSKKCLEMLKKVHCIQSFNGGRGVVFATGTPLSNSISDTYAMQCYLQYDELCKKGLERFDNWIKTFAAPETVCEIDVDTSGFRMIRRFARFFNLPELSKMFGQISVFYNVNADGLPQLLGYDDIVMKKSEALDSYMKELYARTETIRAKKVSGKQDNMLKVSTDGRKAALSLALVGKEEADSEHGKIWNCVQNVLKIYREYDSCTQLIFCDYSTPKKQKYNVYEDLKKHFEECGIPSDEIAFIHACKNEEQKVKLYEAVNMGKVRILIGSTLKLGVGANVQTRLKAIHHLDVPWRPADMVQREGRILRRGNQNERIHIFRYIVEGSFDSYSWQILQTKQHFISQFLSGNNSLRSIEDFDNDELNYAQVKALALSEPLMKEYAQKENELRNARIILHQEMSQKESAHSELTCLTEEMEQIRKDIQLTYQNAEYVTSNGQCLKEQFQAVVQTITDRLPHAAPNEKLSSIGEFRMFVPQAPSDKKLFVILERLGVQYYLELGDSVSGNKRRIFNFFDKFPSQISSLEKKLETLKQKQDALTKQLCYSSQITEQIKVLEQEVKALFEKISNKTNEAGA